MKNLKLTLVTLTLMFMAGADLYGQNQATSVYFKKQYKKEKAEINNTIDSKEKVFLVAKNISKNITDKQIQKSMAGFSPKSITLILS